METLTAQQANKLADHFLSMGRAIGDFRYANHSSLTPERNKEIKELQDSVLKAADELYTISATLVLENIEKDLATMGNISLKMKSTLKQLKNIQKAIDIAAAAADLGSAVISKNPTAITAGISALSAKFKH